jgi:hypothetical protein
VLDYKRVVSARLNPRPDSTDSNRDKSFNNDIDMSETLQYGNRISPVIAQLGLPLHLVIQVPVEDLLTLLVHMPVSGGVQAESEVVRRTRIILPTDNILFALRI